jgi:hypothetical protein
MAKQKEKSTKEVAAPKKPTVKINTVTIIRNGFGYVKGQKVTVGANGVKDLKSKKLI